MAVAKIKEYINTEQQRIYQGLSVIIAVNNCEEYLDSLNNDIEKLGQHTEGFFEIIYVDDGSTDFSWKILTQLCDKSDHIRAIKLRTAFGESSVLEAALEIAKGEKIVFYSSRVRVNPVHIGKLLQKLDQNYDVVVGVRTPRRDSLVNKLVSKLFNLITNKMTSLNLHDINSGVLVLKRHVLDNVPFYGSLNTFLPVLASFQGYKIAEENVEQLVGKFQYSLRPKDYIRRFLDLVSVLFLSKYSKKPLHFLGFLGVIFTLIGAVIDIYLFFYRLFGIGGIAGRPILLLGTVLLVIGIQMIAIGLLGEMIIFTHARNIKEYNIEEILE